MLSITRRRRLLGGVAAAAAVAAMTLPAMAAGSGSSDHDFEHPSSHQTGQQFGIHNVQRQDTPNDPGYDTAEPDDPDGPTSTNLYDEQFGRFGFPSQRTRLTARYLTGPHAGKPQISGFNASGAWKLTRGRPDVTIAILDTGIKWDDPAIRDQIHLNRGELPKPQHSDGSTCSTYDCNGNQRLDVDDYAHDPRVTAYEKKGSPVTAEDLIKAFSDGTDADHNGFVDDIAGWDFFDNDNDPYDASSYFEAHNHGTGRAKDAAEAGNDGKSGLGVCPDCTLMPIRVWDTFVTDGNTFGMGILYATDNGASVIEGANGSIYHSAFTGAASQYAYDKGLVQVFSGDDLNTADHNYAGNYPHAMLIQGTVPDTSGLGANLPAGLAKLVNKLAKTLGQTLGLGLPGTEVPPLTYFRGAGTTQWGGKSSISMEGNTGSVNTAKAAGGAGLVISAAKDAGVDLSADETREILEQSAEDVLPGNTIGIGLADLSQRGWDPHFGWGRANLGAAVSVAASDGLPVASDGKTSAVGAESSPHSGKGLPAEAAIDSPDWWAPVTGKTLHLSGLLRAPDAPDGCFHYTVQWGTGIAPTSWKPVRTGTSCGTVHSLATLDLATVRATLKNFHSRYAGIGSSLAARDPGAPTFNASEPGPFDDQFTVRVKASYDGQALPGVDRRVFTAIPASQHLLAGFPRRLGAGSGNLRYADINGDGTQELLVPTEDGLIHAYEPDGSELPGWPVHTRPMFEAAGHERAPGFAALAATGVRPLEPHHGVVVADLDGDGTQEVVDAAGTHLYVWEPDGKLRPGFPVHSNMSFCGPKTESQPLHHPKCGFFAEPALGRLHGGSTLDIVEAALDGHLYAWDPSGHLLDGYPVALIDTAMPKDKRMVAESINEVAIDDLNGDGKDDIVASDDEEYDADIKASDLSGGITGVAADLLAKLAGGSTRVYAVDGPTGTVMNGWPIHINGVIQDILPFIGPGQDPAIMKLSGKPVVVASSTGGTLGEYSADGKLIRAAQQTGLNLFESAAIGDLKGSGTPALVKYELPIPDALNLLLVGQNIPYSHFEGAWNARTGLSELGFPQVIDDFQFDSASDVAKLTPGSSQQVLVGDGLGLVHAFDGATGRDIAGFPKITGGWLFIPPAVSADGRLAAVDREGYLFSWAIPKAPSCQTEWPNFRHDQQGSGNYDRDGTPPGAPRDASLTPEQGRTFALSFGSPGDDRYCGTAKRYVATVDGKQVDLDLGTPGAGGSAYQTTVQLPAGAHTLRVWAVDDARNAGPAATIAVPGSKTSAGGPGGSAPSSSGLGSHQPAGGDRGPARSATGTGGPGGFAGAPAAGTGGHRTASARGTLAFTGLPSAVAPAGLALLVIALIAVRRRRRFR